MIPSKLRTQKRTLTWFKILCGGFLKSLHCTSENLNEREMFFTHCLSIKIPKNVNRFFFCWMPWIASLSIKEHFLRFSWHSKFHFYHRMRRWNKRLGGRVTSFAQNVSVLLLVKNNLQFFQIIFSCFRFWLVASLHVSSKSFSWHSFA